MEWTPMELNPEVKEWTVLTSFIKKKNPMTFSELTCRLCLCVSDAEHGEYLANVSSTSNDDVCCFVLLDSTDR